MKSKPHLYIITGASKGLGAALAMHACTTSDVINISRTKNTNHEITNFELDLSDTNISATFFSDSFKDDYFCKYDSITFINNASVIHPIKQARELPADETQNTININLISPLLLMLDLLKTLRTFNGKIKIVNISSGAADKPPTGWAVYSLCKAALASFCRSLMLENRHSDNFRIYNINPGLIDTQMQEQIRVTPPSDFPDVSKFIEFNNSKLLQDPSYVAVQIINFLKLDLNVASINIDRINELLKG